MMLASLGEMGLIRKLQDGHFSWAGTLTVVGMQCQLSFSETQLYPSLSWLYSCNLNSGVERFNLSDQEWDDWICILWTGRTFMTRLISLIPTVGVLLCATVKQRGKRRKCQATGHEKNAQVEVEAKGSLSTHCDGVLQWAAARYKLWLWLSCARLSMDVK